MKARNENLTSIDAIMDAEFGKPGTPEREEFRKEAYAYCMGQIICDASPNWLKKSGLTNPISPELKKAL